MTKILTKSLFGIVLAGLIGVIIFNYSFQFSKEHTQLKKISEDYFLQVNHLIKENQRELENAMEDFSDASLRRARTASYIIEQNPEIETNIKELKKLASILEADEIHLFDTSRRIFFGTHPEYYGFSFDSGDQMAFFLPMLNDDSLQLCQEITPNTAENKLMQYAAVWREDKKGIVQVGLIPEKVLKIKNENSLNNIVSLIPSEQETALYIVSEKDGTVLASTQSAEENKNASEIGLPWKGAESSLSINHMNLNGERHCVFFQKYQDMIYIRTYPSRLLTKDIFLDTGIMIIYISLLFIVATILIRYYTNSKLIKGLNQINKDMKQIENGYKYHVSNIKQVPELSELADSINIMTDAIRSAFKNFSLAIEKSNLQIGVYDYNDLSEHFFISERVWSILKIQKKGIRDRDRELLCSRVEEMKKHPYDEEKHIYTLKIENKIFYVHIEEFEYEHHKVLLFVDATSEYSEKEKIMLERDKDYLTNLLTRRAFMEQLENLFQSRTKLGDAAVLIIDADGLKQVNDQNGHPYGDQYLKQIAALISREAGKNAICSRLGGDEFAVLLYGYDSEEELLNVIHNIEANDNSRYMKTKEEKEISLRYSVGYAIYEKDTEDYHELLKYADERMYQKKVKKHK